MPRYKPQSVHSLMVPVVLSDQIVPGSFAFALNYLVDHELDMSELDAWFHNDETGASAYDPRVMLKIVLLAYSQGLISSRAIERACLANVQFIALSGDSQPSHAHIAKFVTRLGEQIKALFSQVLLVCDAQGLIGREMFAIDGVKLPSNASKERSGTHAELAHRARRMEQAAAKIVALHRAQDCRTAEQPLDDKRQRRIDALRSEARRTREFLAQTARRTNAQGKELKTNVTDPDSAKMATSKGVIQGYAAQAAVDSKSQIIVAADVIGSGSEQSMLLPMVQQCQPLAHEQTLYVADAGYHSDANVRALRELGTPALIADSQMRQRDERFKDQGRYKPQDDVLYDKQPTGQAKPRKPVKFIKSSDFRFNGNNTCTCPAGKLLRSNGSVYKIRGYLRQDFKARPQDCGACALRTRCLRKPDQQRARVVHLHTRQLDPDGATQRMQRAIDSTQGRQLYSKRIGTVEPVFANIRHNKGLHRFNLRGAAKVSTQWHLYCLVHNIEKLARSAWIN